MSDKKAPALPKEVAEKYDCKIVPTVVIISNPKEVAGNYDLTQITLANAAKLAKAGKYLVEKSKPVTKVEDKK